MPLTLAALKSELVNDPRGYGYAADLAIGNDSGLVAKLNAARDGTNIPTNPTAAGGQASGIIRVVNASVDTGLIRAAITKAAYDGLTTGDRAFVNWLTGAGFITGTADVLQSLAGIPTAASAVWSAGTRVAMNAAMEAVLRRNGSRAEELFGGNVTEAQVIAAKKLP